MSVEACSLRFWKVTDEERAAMNIPLITGFEDGRHGLADVPLIVEDLLCQVEALRAVGGDPAGDSGDDAHSAGREGRLTGLAPGVGVLVEVREQLPPLLLQQHAAHLGAEAGRDDGRRLPGLAGQRAA